MIACRNGWENSLTPEPRRCDACGQNIPATAKLATRTVTKAQAEVLGIPLTADEIATLCLNCRIRLAELSR
jgi:hypothetical protein